MSSGVRVRTILPLRSDEGDMKSRDRSQRTTRRFPVQALEGESTCKTFLNGSKDIRGISTLDYHLRCCRCCFHDAAGMVGGSSPSKPGIFAVQDAVYVHQAGAVLSRQDIKRLCFLASCRSASLARASAASNRANKSVSVWTLSRRSISTARQLSEQTLPCYAGDIDQLTSASSSTWVSNTRR